MGGNGSKTSQNGQLQPGIPGFAETWAIQFPQFPDG